MSNNSFQRSFRDAVDRARATREVPPDHADDAYKLRHAIMRYFDPIWDICDEMHHTGVCFPGSGPRPHRVSAGYMLRTACEALNSVPQLNIALNPTCTMVVTLATKGQPRTLADLETAKWRCRITQRDGPDLDNQLYGNLESLTEWFARVVADYECESEEPIEPELEAPAAPVDEPEVRPPRREQRVIMLDDTQEESQ